jgi:hypothetical protein
MSEFSALFLKYNAIHETIHRLLSAAPAPIDADAAVAKFVQVYPDLAASLPDLRAEIVAAARAIGVRVRQDGVDGE